MTHPARRPTWTSWRRCRRAAVTLGLGFLALSCLDLHQPATLSTHGLESPHRQDPAEAIRARLAATPAPGEAPPRAAERAELAMLYDAGDCRPLWVEPSGALTGDARDAFQLLADANADGLDPADYQLATLTRLSSAVGGAAVPEPGRIADFDLALSAAMLRYFRHLHLGRIDPRSIGLALVVEPEGHDFVRLLREGLASHSLPETAASLAPPLPQYPALRRQLARYRVLASEPEEPLPAPPAVLRPGDGYAGAEALRRRLRAFGDLPADEPPPVDAGIYDAALADAVCRFQARHGLEPDGVLGQATMAALAVPVQRRVRQIELALERLRWLPDFGDERLIALNIPMFRLWASNGVGATEPGPTMRAIVGRALSTQTPVFVAMLRTVVFRPYWNVPRSILLHEILPAVERDPALIGRTDYEIVRGQSDAAEIVPPDPENLARLREGTLRLRQRPGPGNALGLVKFVFPNHADVYLHGTPAMGLFDRSRRDFSHGCVRVQDPAELAEWVLRDEPGWDRDRIEAAMAAATSASVPLSKPIRVVLFYTTAAVMPADGALHFAEDIYRHDKALEAALSSGPTRR